MKFRCERDVLVEALGTAARAVSGRGGMLPVLSGVRPSCWATADPHRQRPRPHDHRGRHGVAGRADGVTVLPPPSSLADIVPPLAAGSRSRSTSTTRGPHHLGPLGLRPAGAPGRRVPEARRPPRATRCRCPAAELAEALRQVAPAAVHRRRPPDPHRRAAGRRGRRAAPGGHRLLPPGGARPRRHHRPRRGPERAGAAAGRCTRSSGPRRRPTTITVRLGERDAAFEVGTTRITTRLIEGEFPNYRGLIPSSYPNRLLVGREALLDAVRPGAPAGPRGHPRAPRAEGRRPRAGGRHPGRRPGPRGARRQVRGRRAHRGVQPRVPASRASRSRRATRSCWRPSTPSSRRCCARTETEDFLYLLMPVRVS